MLAQNHVGGKCSPAQTFVCLARIYDPKRDVIELRVSAYGLEFPEKYLNRSALVPEISCAHMHVVHIVTLASSLVKVSNCKK